MKRLVKCLFVPCAMMIATSVFAQSGMNTGSGGMGGQTTSPTNTMSTPATPSTPSTPTTTPSSTMSQGTQSGAGTRAGGTTTYPGYFQSQQQKVQDSISRAEHKAKKEARKAEKKADKAKKKAGEKAEKADSIQGGGPDAVLEEALYLRANPLA